MFYTTPFVSPHVTAAEAGVGSRSPAGTSTAGLALPSGGLHLPRKGSSGEMQRSSFREGMEVPL